MTHDVLINDQGSIVLLQPLTAEAIDWFDEHLAAIEPWQRLGDSVAVDHRCAQDIVDGLAQDGFAVGGAAS
jgi:hypothetical protein